MLKPGIITARAGERDRIGPLCQAIKPPNFPLRHYNQIDRLDGGEALGLKTRCDKLAQSGSGAQGLAR
jgi:hypothetical protein